MENSSLSGSADTVDHIPEIEHHVLLGKTVNIGRVVDPSDMAADRLGGMGIKYDEDDASTTIAAADC